MDFHREGLVLTDMHFQRCCTNSVVNNSLINLFDNALPPKSLRYSHLEMVRNTSLNFDRLFSQLSVEMVRNRSLNFDRLLQNSMISSSERATVPVLTSGKAEKRF